MVENKSMCGRFTLNQSSAGLSQVFHVESVPDLAAQYNIAPTQMVATVLQNPENEKREFKQLHWGLIPSWAKDAGMGAKLINARAETVAEKPAFRSAFKHRRCLVIADGFYEWQRQEGKEAAVLFSFPRWATLRLCRFVGEMAMPPATRSGNACQRGNNLLYNFDNGS